LHVDQRQREIMLQDQLQRFRAGARHHDIRIVTS
jgi:hypothetical protein